MSNEILKTILAHGKYLTNHAVKVNIKQRMKENCNALIVTNFDKADSNYTDAICIGSVRIVSAVCHSGAKA